MIYVLSVSTVLKCSEILNCINTDNFTMQDLCDGISCRVYCIIIDAFTHPPYYTVFVIACLKTIHVTFIF